jgi:Zn-dependent peptidase ImmA (M78 family)
MEFAGEFLMPSAEIGKQLNGLNLDKLGELKKEWNVSMQAILFRAKKLGKISESHNRFLWMQISGGGKTNSQASNYRNATSKLTKQTMKRRTQNPPSARTAQHESFLDCAAPTGLESFCG